MANWRTNRILVSILLAFLGFVLVFGESMISAAIIVTLLAFVVLFIAMVWSLTGVDRGEPRSERRDAIGKLIKFVEGNVPERRAQRVRAEVQAAADRAMERAGHVVTENSIHLHDIGLLVYDDLKTPKIYRTSEIPTDAAHIRPFIVLTQPEMPEASGVGVLRFSLVDANRKLRYTSRAKYRLHPGQNFVTPPTWLPLDGQPLNGEWMLHVMLSETPLAILEFTWLQVGGALRAKFNGDGEIDPKTLRQIAGPAQTPLSLDELLADQGEVEIDGIPVQTMTARERAAARR